MYSRPWRPYWLAGLGGKVSPAFRRSRGVPDRRIRGHDYRTYVVEAHIPDVLRGLALSDLDRDYERAMFGLNECLWGANDGRIIRGSNGRLSRVEIEERLSQTKLDVGMRMCSGSITYSH